jgi:ribosomal subunit interface protein
MTLTIKATNTTLTDGIEKIINDKLETLSKFLREEDKVRVEVDVDKKHKSGLVFRAEIDIQPHGYYAEARGSDFYEAWDLVVPKMKEQLVKAKDKAIDTRRSSARKVKHGKS